MKTASGLWCTILPTHFQDRKKELEDNTHFNPYGAYEVAKMVVMGMKKNGLPIVKEVREDFMDFNPNFPDAWDKFEWIPASRVDILKPDGN